MTSLTASTTAAPDRGRTIAYWTATGVLGTEMLVGGMWGILRIPYARETLHGLGYPDYFAVLLGTWYLLGGLAILAPGFPRLKEWAYAGATIVYTGAVVSHLAVHDPAGKVIAPIAFLGVVFASWALRPASRRLASPR
ncbi:DoxX family protein [[Mycobacterium] nativiensis]|uniref:DoxX family protein n=1 Tax=[Mycobacterium] nativiensis TaxID=2855503 RepID=A0ABU5Y203_9MYCO|nr:DoxX family protein [Mycolicibacter sp. MYC340]MEB3032900.1 DoxX family protein [Mycolicibacter sp. MYC340]